MNRTELAVAIQRASYLTGAFRLRSGATATEYFDKYRFEADPVLLSAIASALSAFVPANTQLLAGLELGGVPLATALSLRTGLSVAFVRKAPKSYGTLRLAEGAEIADRVVLVVEDVVTSGGQVLESVQELRARGARVADVLCVIDREAGGAAALAAADIRLHALYRMEELKAAAP